MINLFLDQQKLLLCITLVKTTILKTILDWPVQPVQWGTGHQADSANSLKISKNWSKSIKTVLN